jgi:hypothetical protein
MMQGEATMEGWFPALMTVVGVFVGFGINEYRYRRERKERYQVMTFEKRLTAHQKAFYWCNKLNEALNSNDKDRIHNTANRAQEWWNGNCLYLDPASRKNMIGLMNLSHMYAQRFNSTNPVVAQAIGTVWERLQETAKAISDGIGVEYLSNIHNKEEST